jgi:NADH dehydrogenase
VILLVGVTGNAGNRIARRLLARGERLRLLVRQDPTSEDLPEKLRDLVADGAQVAHGDLKDPLSLRRLVAGVEVVLTTANAYVPSGPGGRNNPETVDRQGNRDLIDAAREAGVRQFVFTSAQPVDRASPNRFVRAKAETEAYLSTSGLPYTILAPTIFAESILATFIGGPLRAGRPVTLGAGPDLPKSFISVEDVAAFGAAVVNHHQALNRRLALGGPRALTWREVVSLAEDILGRSIDVQTVPPGQALPGFPPAVSELFWLIESQDYRADATEAARSFGVRLTPMKAVLGRILGGIP